MISATNLVAASVILLAFEGTALSAHLPTQGEVEPGPAQETSSPAEATAAPSTETDELVDPTPEGALVMEPGTGETVGGFSQVGRLSTRDLPNFSELQDLQAVGDRLVALSAVNRQNEVSDETILHSTDAMTWILATVPGKDPEILDLATTADGLLAAGSVKADGKRRARLWASTDGVEWSTLPAPAAKRVHQIISTEAGAMAVRQGNQIWVSDDGSEWSKAGKVVNSRVLEGPGGVLTWQGGGQDRTVPTMMLHQASIESPVSEVTLPAPLQWDVAGPSEPFMGIDVFALDDEWVMVGSESKAPDTIHVSSNGLDWQDVPRPPEMREGAVRWIARVGDQVQAFGQVYEDDSDRVPGAIWTWQLGEEPGAAETLEGTGDEWINEPVAWKDGYVATGYERNREQSLTLWLMENAAAD